MSITINSLIVTAKNLAFAGVTPTVQMLNNQLIAELLIPQVLYAITRRAANDPTRASLVNISQTIALTDGAGIVGPGTLPEFMDNAAVSDPATNSLSKNMRYIRLWQDFIRPLDSTLGYFTVVDGTGFNLTRPGAVYNPTSGMTGNITLTTITQPVLPATADDPIVVAPSLEPEIITGLSLMLRGDLAKLSEVSD